MAEFPEVEETEDNKRLLATWNRLLDVRSEVQKALEEKRNEKLIGASLEAKVTLRATGQTLDLLRGYKDQLASIMIVSSVSVEEAASGEPDSGLEVEVAHADGAKCERCWNWSTSVGQDQRFPTLDARCVKQIEEGWGGLSS
jgi:isoleucyl-tRNA synthetase